VTAIAAPLSGESAGLSRRFVFNFIAAILMAGAVIMLGKASWIHVKAQVAQVLLERAFTQSIATGIPVKAWNWADTWPVARVEVKRIGAAAIVLQGASGEALAFGPALLNETSKPGERGTSVIAAHRDTHFSFLRDVVVGDVIEVTRNDGLRIDYRVTGMRVAAWNETGIDRHAAGFNLVLSTCYPFDATVRGTQRYIVEGKMVR
jgi:sortase A